MATHRRCALFLLILATAVACLFSTVVSASGSFMSGESSLTCGRINPTGSDCNIRNTCARCLKAEGCAFDVVMRECVAMPNASEAAYAITADPQPDTANVTYCGQKDRYCSSCSVTSFEPICRGDNGCICRSTCDVMRVVELTCYMQKQSSVVYVSILAIGVALPILLWLQRFMARRRGHGGEAAETPAAALRAQLVLEQRQRRQQQRARPPSAMGLQLESWRSNRDTYKMDVDKIELANCYTLMESTVNPNQPQALAAGARGERVSSSSSSEHSESKEDSGGQASTAAAHQPTEQPEVSVVVDGMGGSSHSSEVSSPAVRHQGST